MSMTEKGDKRLEWIEKVQLRTRGNADPLYQPSDMSIPQGVGRPVND